MSKPGDTSCSCMPTFVVEVRNDNEFVCTCNETTYKHPDRNECVECPPGTTKSVQGIGEALCVADDIEVAGTIFAVLGFGFIVIVVFIVYLWRHTGSLKYVVSLMTSPLAVNVISFLSEIGDFGTDTIVCVNVLNSEIKELSGYKIWYTIFIATSTIGFILAAYTRKRAISFHLDNERYIHSKRGGRRMSLMESNSRIVPWNRDEIKKREVEEIERSASHTNVDIHTVYVHILVFVLEDLPFGYLNLKLFREFLGNQSINLKADEYQMMLFSVLLSVAVGAHKLAKVTKLNNLWKKKEKHKNLLKIIGERRDESDDAMKAELELTEFEKADAESEGIVAEAESGKNDAESKQEPPATNDANADPTVQLSERELKRERARQVREKKKGICAVLDALTSEERKAMVKQIRRRYDPPKMPKMPLMYGLKLCHDARSLDEFLYLINMTELKDQIMSVAKGDTLLEIANSGCTREDFTGAGLRSIQAKRLERCLLEYAEKHLLDS